MITPLVILSLMLSLQLYIFSTKYYCNILRTFDINLYCTKIDSTLAVSTVVRPLFTISHNLLYCTLPVFDMTRICHLSVSISSYSFVYSHFGTNFRKLMSFFTKLTAVMCNTGCPAFTQETSNLQKHLIKELIQLTQLKYHRNINLDHTLTHTHTLVCITLWGPLVVTS